MRGSWPAFPFFPWWLLPNFLLINGVVFMGEGLEDRKRTVTTSTHITYMLATSFEEIPRMPLCHIYCRHSRALVSGMGRLHSSGAILRDELPRMCTSPSPFVVSNRVN